MNDLEITKRIAEILGHKVFEHPNNNQVFIDAESYEDLKLFEPLTDGNIICYLIEKYGISIDSEIDHIDQCKYFTATYWKTGKTLQITNKDLKRAVCLCLIEAFKDD